MRRVVNLSILLLLLASPVASQVVSSYTAFPVGWVTARAPSENSVLECANYSMHEWSVENSKQIAVRDTAAEKQTDEGLPSGFVRTKEMPGRAIVQKVSKGWLVGFDAGEFGGGLWWADESGRHTKQLSGENVRAFILRDNAVLVFTGLAHLTIDEGKIYSFTPDSSAELSLIADIGSEPRAAVMENTGAILIAAPIGVLRFTTDNKLERLYHNEAMAFLYANSIVEDMSGAVVVGMRFYVLRLERSGPSYKPVWYIPSACTKTRVKNYECQCVGRP